MAFLPRGSKIERNKLTTHAFYNKAEKKFEFRRKYEDTVVNEKIVYRIGIKLYEEDYNEFQKLMSDEFATLGNLLVDLALIYISENDEQEIHNIVKAAPKPNFKNHINKSTSAGLTKKQCKPIYQLHNDTEIGESTIVRILAKEQLKKMTSTK